MMQCNTNHNTKKKFENYVDFFSDSENFQPFRMKKKWRGGDVISCTDN